MIGTSLLIEVLNRWLDGGVERESVLADLTVGMVILPVSPTQFDVVQFWRVPR
jgi:hypothetical protein